MNLLTVYKAWNKMYTANFGLYKRVYFVYKKISDRDKLGYLKKNLSKGMVVLDIGANIGFYSKMIGKLVGNEGRVYAFEPDETNYGRLNEIVNGAKNITPEMKAVAETTKEIKLYFSDDMNVDHRTYDSGENRASKSIQAISIDDYLDEEVKVNFVKIDIQGYDYFAIQGMKNTIERSKGLTIMGEFWPYGLKRAGVAAADYLALLESYGMQVEFPEGKSLAELNLDDDDPFSYTDYLAKKL